jgi:hypothetical protein
MRQTNDGDFREAAKLGRLEAPVTSPLSTNGPPPSKSHLPLEFSPCCRPDIDPVLDRIACSQPAPNGLMSSPFFRRLQPQRPRLKNSPDILGEQASRGGELSSLSLSGFGACAAGPKHNRHIEDRPPSRLHQLDEEYVRPALSHRLRLELMRRLD